jgi:hypothetical protein
MSTDFVPSRDDIPFTDLRPRLAEHGITEMNVARNPRNHLQQGIASPTSAARRARMGSREIRTTPMTQ